jgi:signal transduction histidine kinase
VRKFALAIACSFVLAELFSNPANAQVPSNYATTDDVLRYLALSDSIIAHQLLKDDELARAYLERGHCFTRLNRPVKAVQAYHEVSFHTNDPLLLASAEFELGVVYHEQRSLSRALEHYRKALQLFEQSDDAVATAHARYKTAVVFFQLGHDDLAEPLLYSVLRDPHVTDMQRALAYETLGEVLYRSAAIDSSNAQFNHAIAIYAVYGMLDEQLANIERIIRGHFANRETDKARFWAESAVQLATEIGEPQQTARALTRLAGNFHSSGEHQEAIQLQELAIRYNSAIPPSMASEQLLDLARYLFALERDADALLALHEARHIAKNAQLTLLEERAARKEAHCYHQRKRYEEAFASLSLADSLQKINLKERYEHLRKDVAQGQFREEQYLRTDFDLRTALEEQQLNNMRNAVIIGVIFFTIIILLLLREFSQKRKLSRVLEWKVYKRTRELRKANKELNTYIYKSSHDLRTPLTSIKSLLRLLEKEEHTASTKKYLGLIASCSEQMDDILINLSRAVDYKKVDVKVEQIDFNKIKYQIQEKELTHLRELKVDWDIQEAGAFYSDFKLIKVILQQTIANAIAYRKGTKDDYCLVRIYTEPSGARITVEDNGQGISEKVKDKVFDMFVKGTHKSTGAGLGLYLVRIAVDKIRAKVRLETEENRGSKLIFELPNLN